METTSLCIYVAHFGIFGISALAPRAGPRQAARPVPDFIGDEDKLAAIECFSKLKVGGGAQISTKKPHIHATPWGVSTRESHELAHSYPFTAGQAHLARLPAQFGPAAPMQCNTQIRLAAIL